MSSPALSVRPLESSDLQHAVALFIDAYREGEWSEEWSADRAELRIEQIRHSPGSIGLCCTEGTELVGVILGRREIRLDEDYFFVDELFVSPVRQKRGVGARLVQSLERMLCTAGYRGAMLLTLREGSVAEFYSKAGYTIGPRMALFRKDPLDTAC
jgi:GNAT superfamily N-acetyltransferase